MRTAALTIWFSIWFLVGWSLAHGAPTYEVNEFRDNRDGTATLLVTCANGKEIRFTVDRKRLDMLDEEGLYAIIVKECQ